MKYLAEINILPLKELLDPQGKAVLSGLHNLGFKGIQDVRVGKKINIVLEAENENSAREQIDIACKKLLANLVIENYEFTIKPFKTL
ncbi:MAG: phosphoribosylformylglycinamidine synthase [Bacteroidetes bacterium RIFCSPLOWO2_02_FULL_36_8]|nr:MAG: phosphoribosylformylglycinamidine synthase [Bacteroidetes bacterium RIFCSPLOWO2_02_FULL_36_8]OFY71948.1 MAG: phosphoribosylformylglycinamidine synthase [Bacteroidetes bacterium RIFCSPLOWO2_12_FULL_37_12]